MHCEHNLYFLWDRFKHIGDSQFLEIVTTSKEIMPFHDHGVVVFRFDFDRSDSSSSTTLSYFLVEGGLQFVKNDVDLSEFCLWASWIFFLHTSRNEH